MVLTSESPDLFLISLTAVSLLAHFARQRLIVLVNHGGVWLQESIIVSHERMRVVQSYTQPLQPATPAEREKPASICS